jgi:hypothetical protein
MPFVLDAACGQNTQRLIPGSQTNCPADAQAGDAVVCHKLSPAAFTNNEGSGMHATTPGCSHRESAINC